MLPTILKISCVDGIKVGIVSQLVQWINLSRTELFWDCYEQNNDTSVSIVGRIFFTS
jgi:hypothetical protein